MGVQVFFSISGFIITSLLLAEEQSRGQVSIGAFYVRRAFRILPPLWCYVVSCLLLREFGRIEFSNQSVFSALTFTCNLATSSTGWFFAHIWSLSVEEQFYLIWPILFTILPSRHRSRFLLATVIALSILTLFDLSSRNTVSFSCIALGALYACSPNCRLVISKYGSRWKIILVAIVILLSINLRSLPLLFAFIHMVIPFGISFILFASRSIPSMGSILSVKPIQVVGLGSYSLYLWQQPFLAWPTDVRLPALSLLLLPIVACMSFMLIEKPLMKLGRGLSDRIKGAQSLTR